jgi:hypothetical protein
VFLARQVLLLTKAPLKENKVSYAILNKDDLSRDGKTYEFVGAEHDQVDIHTSKAFVTHWLED